MSCAYEKSYNETFILLSRNGSTGNIRPASSNRFVCPTNSRSNQGSEWDNNEIVSIRTPASSLLSTHVHHVIPKISEKGYPRAKHTRTQIFQNMVLFS